MRLCWSWWGAGVERYGCIPQSTANNLGEIPRKWGLQMPYFEELFCGRNTLALVPASLPHTLGYACTLYTPTSPLTIIFSFVMENNTIQNIANQVGNAYLSGTNFCTGDFAPPEPEFRAANSGKQILDARILDLNSLVECFDSVFSSKRGSQQNSPSRNSPPKIHLPKFNPGIGPRNSHCTSTGPYMKIVLEN